MNSRHLKLISVACIATGTSSQIAGGAELSEEFLECRALESAVARLDCYDRLVDATSAPVASDASAEPGQAGTPAGDPPAATDISQEALFGKDPVEVRESVQKATGSTEIDRLQALVTSVRFSATGKAIIDLDNGQVWTQIDNTRLRLAAYDQVTIRRASLGSFMLSKAGSKTSMRVKRIS